MKIKMINLGNRGNMILEQRLRNFPLFHRIILIHLAWKYFALHRNFSFHFPFFFFSKLSPSFNTRAIFPLYISPCVSRLRIVTPASRISKISIHSRSKKPVSRRNCWNGWCELSTIDEAKRRFSRPFRESIALCSLINIDYTRPRNCNCNIEQTLSVSAPSFPSSI